MAGGNELLIYTDGACIPNPGRGGWGIVIVQPTGELRKLSGSAQEQTTSSRMEMTAVLMALRKLSPSGVPVVMRIDSEFVVLRLHGKYRQKKNKDLWIEIDRERSRLLSRLIHFECIKGHADDPYNAMADELANTAAGSRTSGYAEPAHLGQVKKGLKCNECSEPMRPVEPHAEARAVGQQWFRCNRCKRSAYKDARGAHYIPVKISARPGLDPADNPLAITAPLDPALKGPTNWRRKFRRPK